MVYLSLWNLLYFVNCFYLKNSFAESVFQYDLDLLAFFYILPVESLFPWLNI